MRAEDDAGLVARARAHLDLAISAIDDARPRLVAIGGLSGTDKSTLARSIGGDIRRVPSARILRNDVITKRLAGVTPETRLEPASYTASAADRVYETLDTLASTVLASGPAVIVDAVFAPALERQAIANVAKAASVRFDAMWLPASNQTRQERVIRPQGDASDADAEVALAQAHLDIGDLGTRMSLFADGQCDAGAARLRALLNIGSL